MKYKILHGIFLPPIILGIIYLSYLLLKTFENGGDGGWELTLFFHGIIFSVFLLAYFCIWGIIKIFEGKKL